jgi:hypothetical protein
MLDRVVRTLGFERRFRNSLIIAYRGRRRDRGKRSTHGMLAVTLGDFRVTASTGGIPDIPDHSVGIPIRRACVRSGDARCPGTAPDFTHQSERGPEATTAARISAIRLRDNQRCGSDSVACPTWILGSTVRSAAVAVRRAPRGPNRRPAAKIIRTRAADIHAGGLQRSAISRTARKRG